METQRLVETLAGGRPGKQMVDEFIAYVIDRSRSIARKGDPEQAGDALKLSELAEEFQNIRQQYNNQTADILSRMEIYIHSIITKQEDIEARGVEAQKVLRDTWAGVEDVATLLKNFLFVLRHDIDLAYDILRYLAADEFLLTEITTRLTDAEFNAIGKVFTHDQKRRDRLKPADGQASG